MFIAGVKLKTVPDVISWTYEILNKSHGFFFSPANNSQNKTASNETQSFMNNSTGKPIDVLYYFKTKLDADKPCDYFLM